MVECLLMNTGYIEHLNGESETSNHSNKYTESRSLKNCSKINKNRSTCLMTIIFTKHFPYEKERELCFQCTRRTINNQTNTLEVCMN